MAKKKVNKKYKDTVFRMIFGKDRHELLELYNAVNDSAYTNADDPGNVSEYRLSEMFVKAEEDPQLELVVRIVNINEGCDNRIVNNCKTLREYSRFVSMIRNNRKTMDIEDAVKKAVNDCIRQDILRKFLLKHKARVIEMSILYEYDEKKQRMLDHKDGVEEGIEIGEQIGDQIRLIIMIQKKVKKAKTLDTIADELESTVEEIKPLYDAVIKYPPDTDPKEIYSHL